MSTNPNLLPTSKMTRSVIDAFKGLNVGSAQDVSDHEAIYEVSYQYLSKVKQFKDLEAFHNCLVSLINTDKYYKALTLINEVPTEIHQEYPLEKAYVYYKTGNTDLLKALYDTTVASSGLSEVLLRAMKHVMAQSCYQNGEVTHALKLYHELISSNAIDSQIDLACNERAILSQVLFKTSSSQKPLLNLANADDSYDFIFNNALIELAKGNLAGSLDLLNSALDLCKTQNMDSDPADLALESTPINLTIAYIYQVTGREQKAIDVLENLDLADTADLMLQLIVKNNLISVQPVVDNVNYSSRELNYHHNLHHLRSKLTKSQSKVLLKNHLLLSYQTNTLSKSSTYVSNRFIKQFITDSEGDYSPLVYKVLLKLDVTFEDIENPETNRAISRKLLKFANAELEKNVASDILVAAALLLVALNSKVSKFDQSTLVLEKLVAIELAASDAPLHGSIFKAIIEVYELSNSAKKLSELYTAIVTKFKSLSVESIRGNDNLYKLILAVAVKLSTVDLEAESAELLNLLLTVKESEVVASILNSNADGLLSVQELESEADVETLLAVNVEELAPKLPVPKAKKIKQADFKVKKKTTKPKFSKNKFFKPASEFDPEKDLDREKWLPMKLRSYYKPSKKELKKKSGGHQGAIESSPAPQVAQQVSSSSKSKKTKKKKGKK